MTLSDEPGRVYVVATPIGNLADLSARAQEVLREVDLIACEDTRRTARLCNRYGIKTRRMSLHEHNEVARTPRLLALLAEGRSIALVSDAGTPLLSDPGERFVAAALDAGTPVVPVPGASAVLAALVASGLPMRRFTFEGFLPRRGSARRNAIERLARFPGTLVIFEAPGRTAQTLRDLHAVLGPRRVALARELTKLHEQVLRGRLGELEPGPLRGEVTLVVEGAEEPSAARPAEVDALLEQLLAEGLSVRDAARRAASETGLSRSETYRRALALADGG